MKCDLGRKCLIRDQIGKFPGYLALNQAIAAALEGKEDRIVSILAAQPMPLHTCVALAEILQKAMKNPPKRCEQCGVQPVELAA